MNIKEPPPLITINEIYNVVPLDVISSILNGYHLDFINGVHSIRHWLRVMENGLTIASMNGASKKIIIAFSLFHDCRRHSESFDPLHGERASEYILKFKSSLGLSEHELDLVTYAIKHHSDGRTSKDIHIGTCWDADRLDLMRIDTYPSKDFLSTDVAKEAGLIVFCNTKAVKDDIPSWGQQIINDIF
jgi:uncharacterized protein